VSEGKLDLDTRLDKFYPEFANSGAIKIEHLLQHRSGIFNYTNAPDLGSWMESPVTREELITKLVANGTTFTPDEKMEYSNSNYVLLSFIAEKVEGKEFSDMIQERICTPCSLGDTYYGRDIASERNEAQSYKKGKDWIPATETDMSVPAGAGAIVSTPTDLNKFLHCLFEGNLSSTVSLDDMIDLRDGYGMGIFQVPFYERKAYGHNGAIDGFRASAFFFPDEKVSMSYTANAVSMAPNDINIGVLSVYFGKEYSFPEFKEPIALAPETLDQYVGVYSSPTFPLKVTITKTDSVLTAQATGQPSFVLDAYEPHKFKFDAAQLKMEFKPEANTMILKQAGKEFELTKE
jgi:D-alanyl-D-alanine carboxypeptidase